MNAALERRRNESDQQRGYTLIELLLVIVILSVLAAVVLIAVQSLTHNAARASCTYDVQTVDHAIEAYQLQMAKQPTSISDLMPVAPVDGADGTKVGPWLHNLPTNGTKYSVVVYKDAASNRDYAAVVTPGSTSPSVTHSTGTTWNAIVFEPDGDAAAATTTAPQVVTTTSAACGSAG